MYGNRANSNPLNTATNIVAVLFMFTSITLALYSTQNSSDSNVANTAKELEMEFSNEYFKLDIPKITVLPSEIMTPPPIPSLPENSEQENSEQENPQ